MIPRSLLFFSIFLQATYGGPIFANYIRNSYFNQQEFPSSKRYEVNLDSLLIVLYEKKKIVMDFKLALGVNTVIIMLKD